MLDDCAVEELRDIPALKALIQRKDCGLMSRALLTKQVRALEEAETLAAAAIGSAKKAR